MGTASEITHLKEALRFFSPFRFFKSRAQFSGSVAEGLVAFSGDGRFHARYRKVGSEVEFFNAAGERFWRLPSLEYPYLSRRGRLIFLMNGDQSGIRIAE